MTIQLSWLFLDANDKASVSRGYLAKCGVCQSIVTDAMRTFHENYHKTFGHRRETDMADVKWCDRGDHAYKAGERGSASFEGIQFDNDGRPVNVRQDVCAAHNPNNVTVDVERAITRQVMEAE